MFTLKKFHTVLFSTVLKPTSEILGSFSPSSKAHKTLVASENIPRSVRTRTYNEIKKKIDGSSIISTKNCEWLNSKMASSNSKQSFGFLSRFLKVGLRPPPHDCTKRQNVKDNTTFQLHNFSCNEVYCFYLISVSFSSGRLHF